jgi:hypothetical protein
MCRLSLLLQGLLVVWSVSGLVILTAIAFVYARAALLRVWQAKPASRFRDAGPPPAATPRSGAA